MDEEYDPWESNAYGIPTPRGLFRDPEAPPLTLADFARRVEFRAPKRRLAPFERGIAKLAREAQAVAEESAFAAMISADNERHG